MFFGRGIIVNGFLVENMLLLLWNVDDFDMCSDFKVFLKWGFLAEGDVSLGVNRRQRWEILSIMEIYGGGVGCVGVLNYRGQQWKLGIFPPISWRVFLVSHPRVKTSDTVDIYIFSF